MVDLAHALRVTAGECVAFVGAGGKTSAMFRLARELNPPVLVTTTTRLSLAQAAFADHHRIINPQADLTSNDLSGLEGVTLISGEVTPDGHLSWLPEALLEMIYRWAAPHGISILIEADGARQLPLKAPADHEPVIPSFVNCTVVLAGLAGLGKPLGETWVHRPERFALLSGLQPGEIIGADNLAKVLISPFGGLKGIPSSSRRMVLLNQADTPELQGNAQRLAQRLLSAYEAVIVASLAPGMTDETLESGGIYTVNRLSQGVIHAVYERVAGIILAAGGSQRMGRPKQLLPWRGRPLVKHVVESALQAGLDPITVVTGDAADQVEKVLDGMPVGLVYNPDWASGQSTSLRSGLKTLPSNVGAAIFLLADQPQIPPALLTALIEAHSTSLAPIVAPLVDGQRGNPVLFDRMTFSELSAVQGDMGGRALFSRYPIAWVPWHDARVLLDVDVEGDYARLLEIN